MKKIFTLVVAIFMILAIFTACNKNGGDSIDTSTEAVETTESIETTVQTEETSSDTESEETEEDEYHGPISLLKDGKTDFVIVQSDSPSIAVSGAGSNLRKAFQTATGAQINFYKESAYKTLNGGTMSGPKIIIDVLKQNKTSKSIFDSLDNYYYHYTIKVSDDSLYIIGASPVATVNAINYFIDTYLSEKINSLDFEETMTYKFNPTYPIENLSVNGNSIFDYAIVHYDSYYAKQAALKVQESLLEFTGKKLPVVSDDTEVRALEILVGKTNRNESKTTRAKYSRPNVYYDITEANGKLVVMAEGFSTLEVINKKLDEYLASLSKTHNVKGSAVSGDIILSDNADNVKEGNMLIRADGTDVRVMAWNMGGPGTYGKIDLAEKLADTILKNLPDVFGTNEFYDPPSGAYRTTFDAVMREISEYYYEIESDNDFPNDSRLASFVKSRGPRPQKIFIKKDSGIKVIAAGWRYTEYQKDVNYRSFPWAVLETKDGDKFIYTVSHYTNMTNDTAAAIEQLEAVAHAQAQSGSNTDLPTILSGDLWMSRGKGSYKYFTDRGYMDAQREALVNDNKNITHGTFHDYGEFQPTRSITDRIMYSSGMTPLKFKVITSREALDSSDHSPICTDFKFN